MSKPTMGRGLGDLLTQTKPQGDNQNQDGKTQIAAGVRTLMQGAAPVATPKAAPAAVSATANAAAPAPVAAVRPKPFTTPKPIAPVVKDSKGPAIPRWIFLAADAVLIALALVIALKAPKPMPTSRMILAIVITVLAAGCGLCALLAGTEKD